MSAKSNLLEDNEFTLLQFHAPWCRPCDRLKAGYNLLGTNLKANALTKDVRVARWNVEEEGNEEFAEKMGARPDSTWTLPFIVMMKGSKKLAVFDGDRDDKSIGNFVMASQRGRVVSVADTQAVHDLVEAVKPTIVMLGMYNSFKQTSENSAFYSATALLQLGEIPTAYFAITTNKDTMKDLGMSTSIMLLRAGINEPNLPMEENLVDDAGEIFKFVELNRAPLLIYNGHKTSAAYLSEAANQIRLMIFLNDIEDASSIDMIKRVAKKFRQTFLTVLVGPSETVELDEYKLALSEYQPGHVLLRDFSRYGQRRVWSMPDTTPLNEDPINEFIGNVLNGTIKVDELESKADSTLAIDSPNSASPSVEQSEPEEQPQSDDPYDEL